MDRPAWLLPAAAAGVIVGIATADAGWVAAAIAAAGLGVVGATLVATLARRGGRMLAVAGAALVAGILLGGLRWSIETASIGPGSVAALEPGTQLAVIATVADEPVPRGEAVDIVLDEVLVADRPVRGRLLVRVPRAVVVASGDRVALEVSLRPPLPESTEARSYHERLRRQGIGAQGRAYDLAVVGHVSSPLADAFAVLRRWLLDGIVTTVPEPEAALGAGILLGVRAGIDPAIRDAFAVAGLSHVVAISGWNVAIVIALIAALTQPLRRSLGPVAPSMVAVAAVIGFVILVGGSPAVVRAALMAGALLVARLGGSPAHAGSALMAAVLVMLLAAPAALWDVGFQLSALATAGLIVLGAPIERRLGGWPGWLRTPVALTVAAQLATLPVLLATFGQVSLVAPLANVAVVPLVPAVMAGTGAAALVGGLAGALPVPLVADAVAWLAGGAAWLPLSALIAVGTAAAALPMAALPLAGGPWLTAGWYPLLVLVARRLARGVEAEASGLQPLTVEAAGASADTPLLPEAAAFAGVTRWLARPRRAAVGLSLLLALATLLSGPDGRLHLTVLDIGQGDAILIEAPDGATALVDGGVDPDLTLRRLGQNLPFHQRRIDVVLLSHPHQDHLGGLGEVLRRFEVGAFVDGGRLPEGAPHRRLLVAAAGEPGAMEATAVAGRVIPLGGRATLEVLFPTGDDVGRPVPEGDINNASIVAVLRYGRFSALLTGDAEAPVEALLAERNLLQPVDVLKVGHHGSDSSSTDAFLAATSPAVAIISAGRDNEYGHPHRSTLDNLAAVPGLVVYRTDRDGSVEVVTDGAAFWIVARGRQSSPIRAGSEAGRSEPAAAGMSTAPGMATAWALPAAGPPAGVAGPVRFGPGRIDPWPSPTETLLASCSTACPTGWSPIPKAWPALPPRPPARWRTTVWRSTSPSSRPPGGSTTSTSSRPEPMGGAMGWRPPPGLLSSAMPSSPTRSPPIRPPACSIRSATRAGGSRSASRWPIAGSADRS